MILDIFSDCFCLFVCLSAADCLLISIFLIGQMLAITCFYVFDLINGKWLFPILIKSPLYCNVYYCNIRLLWGYAILYFCRKKGETILNSVHLYQKKIERLFD